MNNERNGGASAPTAAQLNLIAQQVCSVLYEMGGAFQLPPSELGVVAAIVAVNVNVTAHGAAGVEYLRDAADVAEKQLAAELH